MKRYWLSLCFLFLICAAARAETDVTWTALSAEERTALQTAGETVLAPDYPVPDYVVQLLSTAKMELGYQEQRGNVTKYGIWAGNPSAEWCAEYLCWSVNQTDQMYGTEMLTKVYPLYGGTNVGLRWFLKEGRYIARKGTVPDYGSQWLRGSSTTMEKNSYVPQPGDWVFFSTIASGDTTHVAMVEFCTVTASGEIRVHVLEGNRPDRVQQAAYTLSDETILGYGTVYDLADIVLRQGQEGKKVLALQEQLAVVGLLDEQYVTGRYGQSTTDAVRAYQKSAGKEGTGIANHHTQIDLAEYVREYYMQHPELWAVDEE